MMMSRQNMSELPAFVLELLLDDRRLGCVDARGRSRVVVVDQHAIVILAADELMHVEVGHLTIFLLATSRVTVNG